jgi:PhzF family phenazine biosynthesis protein
MQYRYRILNVFTIDGDRFSGNPLCVFEDARGLDDETMQALALQFNLSETTFIFPSERATAKVRIFTPSFEMPFAGHPTLGTAHIVRDLKAAGDTLTLEMKAGVIPVQANANRWTLQANAPTFRKPEATREQLAEMLTLRPTDIGENPLWVNVGSEQLIVPLTSAQAVERCIPVVSLLKKYGRLNEDRYLAYVWAQADSHSDQLSTPNSERANLIDARFFFPSGTAIAEDPATGSACANLGGWFVASQASLPVNKTIRQGSAIKRSSHLYLHVDARKQIFVSGDVNEIATGALTL